MKNITTLLGRKPDTFGCEARVLIRATIGDVISTRHRGYPQPASAREDKQSKQVNE